MPSTQACCPDCGSAIYTDADEQLCEDCGLVVDADRIDRGPEWRSFDDDRTDPKRTGSPLTDSRHDRGLSTEIGYMADVSADKRRQFARLRRQHNRARVSSKRARNQIHAFTRIKHIVSNKSLPTQIRDYACSLFRSAQSEDLLRGRSIEGFVAACLYAACRMESLSRTIDEITEASHSSREEFEAAYAALNRDLGLPIGPTHPREYLPRYANELGLSPAIERRAHELADRTEREGILNGRNPSGVAAACLYTAAKENGASLTQREAASVASVTPVTLRTTYRELGP
ncbi:MAG: transcription initiation factor IIB [Halohasta sp.]